MVEDIYLALTNLGYTHPLHPALTHLPIGMVMGAVCFALIALIFRKPNLARTAMHCSVLALIGAAMTVVLGLMDWQHFYGGSPLFPIKVKMVLAGFVIIFLLLAIIFGFFSERFSNIVITMYVLCLFCVIGLGYFGGELVYGTEAPALEVSQGPAAEGALVFNQSCSACHLTDSTATKIGPGLKGLFKGDKFPASGWPVSEENLRKRLREPFDKMPPFGHLPLEQVQTLMAYLKTL